MNNRSLLTIVIVLLLGIFAVVAYEGVSEDDSFGEEVSESIGEVGEEIDDEIDDATTN